MLRACAPDTIKLLQMFTFFCFHSQLKTFFFVQTDEKNYDRNVYNLFSFRNTFSINNNESKREKNLFVSAP